MSPQARQVHAWRAFVVSGFGLQGALVGPCDTADGVTQSLTVWTDDRGDGRLPLFYTVSMLLHLVGVAVLWWWGPLQPLPPEEKRISIELVAQGRGPQPHAAMAVQPPSAPPSQPVVARPVPKAPPAPRGRYRRAPRRTTSAACTRRARARVTVGGHKPLRLTPPLG